MTSDSSTVVLLERALDQTERLITAIGADQAGLATPCSGWDVAALVQHLAVATGQLAGLDPALAEYALSWSHRMMRPESRGPGRAFGPEVPVPPGAPVYERLAGWFGRDPRWAPSGR